MIILFNWGLNGCILLGISIVLTIDSTYSQVLSTIPTVFTNVTVLETVPTLTLDSTLIQKEPSIPKIQNAPSLSTLNADNRKVVLLRPNVVKENPSLDVGPLVEVTVTEGGAARLPCTNQPLNSDDAVRLVLWYRNDTSRPLLSYDARSNTVTSTDSAFEGQVSNILVHSQSKLNNDDNARIFLSNGGSSLVIKGVKKSDETEYRCKVHYSHSPSVANRLKLIVANTVHGIQLLDTEGRTIGDHVGPLSEDSHLSLSCRTKFSSDLVNLEWLVDGKSLTSSWTRTTDDFVVSNLELPLKRSHAHASLTCRLNAKDPEAKNGIKAFIKDASTTILMLYVPQATLIIDSAASDGLETAKGPQGGVTYRVTEGMTVTFICAVKARPPPYNISWLHNGRIIGSGSRRWTKHNSSLVVSPVNKEDMGLYTCLASNTEGDGQSNALNLKVSHAPHCAGPSRRQVVVIKNSSISLICEVDAEPPDVSFTWTFDPSNHRHTPGPNMQIYSPNSDSKANQHQNDTEPSEPVIQTDPLSPKKSILTLTPESSIQGIVCFAKNKIGRMQVPCAFSLTFIDPLQAPHGCNVEVISSTEVTVSCLSSRQGSSSLHDDTPGISYVLSPEAKTSSHLEVWDHHTLLYNLTEENPRWELQGLPPNTNLILRLYSTSSHSQSDPIILHTRTKLQYYPVKSGAPSTTRRTFQIQEVPNVDSVSEEAVESNRRSSIGILSVMFGLLGGVVVILCLIILSIFYLKRRGRRRPLGDRPISIQSSSVAEEVLGPMKETVSQDALVETETST